MPHIGTLTEKSLHAGLKSHFARPGDEIETQVEGFVIDIARGTTLIEIQTGGFTPLKRKLATLLAAGYHVHLIHPIPAAKWIVRQTARGRQISRRKSPRKGNPLDIYRELIRIPHLLPEPGLTIEAVLTHQEEIWVNDGQGSWRRKGWSIRDQRLLEVTGSQRFSKPADYLAVIPDALPRPFTTRTLAKHLGVRINLAQKMAYALTKAGWLERVGKKGNAFLYHEIRAG